MKRGLALALMLLSVCVGLLGCQRAATREDVLRGLIERQLVPDMSALAEASAALTAAAHALSTSNFETSRLRARSAWREALKAWERVYAFRVGPIVDNSGLLRARFWPVRENALRALLAQPDSLDEAKIDQLGVDVRGMYALEWLLYGEPSRGLLGATSESGVRARTLAAALAQNAQTYVERARAQLGNGATLAATLSEAAQESVSRVINQMIATVETLASDRLAPVLEMHAQHSLRASEVQGAPSGMSRELVLAQLSATERLYLGTDGAGLTALVAAVAPAIDARVRGRFVNARTLVERIEVPLEQRVVRDRTHLEDALRALKELELALKVDLASALGITLTFTASDGD